MAGEDNECGNDENDKAPESKNVIFLEEDLILGNQLSHFHIFKFPHYFIGAVPVLTA